MKQIYEALLKHKQYYEQQIKENRDIEHNKKMLSAVEVAINQIKNKI